MSSIDNDGSNKAINAYNEANAYLETLGKRGKRCKLKITGDIYNRRIELQFTHPVTRRQAPRGTNLRLTVDNVAKAKGYAESVTNALVNGFFTDEWLDTLLGKAKPQQPTTEIEPKEKTCKEMYSEYRSYWEQNHKHCKSDLDEYWRQKHGKALDYLKDIDKPINEQLVKQAIESTTVINSCVRVHAIQGIKSFLEYHGLTVYPIVLRLQKDNKPTKKTDRVDVPTDKEIEQTLTRFVEHEKLGKSRKSECTRPKMTFIYKLLAIYGLRIHEVFNIKNWDKPVILKQGDWVTVDINDSNNDDESTDKSEQWKGTECVIPAITDPSNTNKILAIGKMTKTGYRLAYPLSPLGKDWIKDWGLIQDKPIDELLPDWAKKQKHKTSAITCYFYHGLYSKAKDQTSIELAPFTPHKLRHAYNHRAHSQGINGTMIAQSLGHKVSTNTSTYLRQIPIETKLEGLKNAFSKPLNEQSELEQARLKIKGLELENQRLRERLTEMEMMLQLTSR